MMADGDRPKRPRSQRRAIIGGAVVAAVVTSVVFMRAPNSDPTAVPADTPEPIAVLPSRSPGPNQPEAADGPQTTVTTDQKSGSFLGIGWRSASVRVTAGGSVATASALTIGAHIGSWDDVLEQSCFDVVTSNAHSGAAPDPTLSVSINDDTAVTATIQVHGSGGGLTQTIVVELAACPSRDPKASTTPGGTSPAPAPPSNRPRPGGMRPI